MKKTSIIFLAFILVATFLPGFALAQDEGQLPVYLTIFHGSTCPHCHDELAFLEKLEKEFPNLEIRELEVFNSKENIDLMRKVAQDLNTSAASVPFTLIGNEVVAGYFNDQTTGARIKSIVQRQSAEGSVDFVGEIINSTDNSKNNQSKVNWPENITLPFFGEINIKSWSLPILTIVIAAIDGFNPCAMWVLLFLISLLLGMEDRRKMWTLGTAFIVASALTYFLFLAAWLNLFLFLSFIAAIRIIIGLVAVGSGGYHLKEWWSNRNATCRAVNEERRKKIINQLRRITEQKAFYAALVGIIVLAFTVNLVELVCSAGLPAIYTQILSSSNLATPVYYLYLLLYILIFMLDDLLVFVIAMTTLRAVGISNKYTHWANFVGGIVILILGILLIFKPGWVMLG